MTTMFFESESPRAIEIDNIKWTEYEKAKNERNIVEKIFALSNERAISGDYEKPMKTIPRSPGHHKEWIDACKGGQAAGSNFDYASQLTETVLLGNIALRTGEKIIWDSHNMKITNDEKANNLIGREYRKGWEI